VDPPWKEGQLRQEILEILLEAPPLSRMVVVESPTDAPEPTVPANAQMVRRATYGGTALLFYEWDEDFSANEGAK
jgi:16S rRNA G966 N2-methylase RsmD